MVELIGSIIGALGLLGGMIGVWINLNLKIKELEVKILNIEMEQNSINKRIDKNEDYSRQDHKVFDEKLDKIFELLTTLVAEHNFQKCSFNEKNK